MAAMLLGYRLDEPYNMGDLSELPDFVRPAVELEAAAPGSWYVNAVAVFPAFRGRGFGTELMALAERLAAETGAAELSLIVLEENAGAKALYERLGYAERTRRDRALSGLRPWRRLAAAGQADGFVKPGKIETAPAWQRPSTAVVS